MKTEREKLIEELMCIVIRNNYGGQAIEAIADFMLEDRRRIGEEHRLATGRG